MSFTISNNSAAASSNYYLGKNQDLLQTSIKRLASGKKIIRPSDDPGSLSVAMKLNASISRLTGARNNVQNGTSFLEVQDGVLDGVGKIVTRMSELKGLGSQDPMKSSQDIESYNLEFRDLQRQLYDMSQMTFNGASLFANYANDAIRTKGHFSLVLAGGNTPKKIYESLSKRDCDWGNWNIYFGDERCLPSNDKDRNSLMAEKSFFSKVSIPKNQINIVPAELGMNEGAEAYEKKIKFRYGI